MPPYPGEERLVTLFADCHYYFAQPTTRPVLHRFDKASYFYIYWNSTRHTSRIEVANNAGTPEQDAFHGYLDTCRVINSHKFPTLVTLVIDAIDHAPSPVSSKPGRDPEEWQLPSSDPRDTSQMKYRLHTIDFYFWTVEDARLVTNFFRKLLSPVQLDLAEAQQQQQPQSQQQQQHNRQPADAGISTVVQNLENVAISDPAYSNGQTRNSQNQPQVKGMHLPPPPPPLMQPVQSHARHSQTASPPAVSPSPVSQSSYTGDRASPQSEKPAAHFTPLVYNPAAPAAPEKIAHREKTPPPEDDEHGTGLSTMSTHDYPSTAGYSQAQSWGAPPTTSQSSYWGSPPPQSTTSGYGVPPPPAPIASTYGSPPPPSATSGYGSQISSNAGYTSPPPPASQYQQNRTQAGSAIPSFAPPPVNPTHSQDSHRHSMAAELYTPDTHAQSNPIQPVETPGTQFLNTVQPPQKPLQHIQPQYADYLSAGTKPGQQPPPGGWSQYSHSQSAQGSQSGPPDAYDIHNQVYRPTEAEANRRHSKPSRTDTAISQSKTASKARGFLKKVRQDLDKL